MSGPLSRDVRRPLARGGFTLVELMIVIAIIAIVAAIAVPNLIAAKIQANEAAAISVMRSISTAQAQFWRSQYADENGNGQGEYGVFGELSGVAGVRGGGSKSPTDLTASLANVTTTGEVKRSGYVFRMYLPEAAGVGRGENPGGGMTAGVLSPDLAELHWCCYAYPQNHDSSGRMTFFVSERSEITKADDSRYEGAGCAALRAGAAYVTGDLSHMTGAIAIGTRAADGNLWRPVQ